MTVVNRILITGATGSIGGEVVSQLLAAKVPVRAMVRNPQTSAFPPEVEVVRGDFTIPATLDKCLDGIDTVFLVWVAPAAAIAPAVGRLARRARRIVLLSAPLKTPHPLFQQPNASRTRAEMLERQIENSGLQWTFLRPGMFASNALGWWAPQIRIGNVVRWPYLRVPTAPIDARDVAAVAVHALCEDGQSGAEYVLTGPQSLTQFEQIETIGSVLGRSLDIEEVAPGDWLADLPAFVPSSVAKYLLDAWGAAIGRPAFVTSTVAELTGSSPRTFRQWVSDHVGEFNA